VDIEEKKSLKNPIKEITAPDSPGFKRKRMCATSRLHFSSRHRHSLAYRLILLLVLSNYFFLAYNRGRHFFSRQVLVFFL
jgi:hypothetical protein